MQIYGAPFVAESLRLGFANYEVLKWYLQMFKSTSRFQKFIQCLRRFSAYSSIFTDILCILYFACGFGIPLSR